MGVVVSGCVGLGRKIRVQENAGASAGPGGGKQRSRRLEDPAPQTPTLPERGWLHEMEAELEEQMRGELLRKLADRIQQVAAKTDAATVHPPCPSCSRPMQSKDPMAERTLRTAGGEITLKSRLAAVRASSHSRSAAVAAAASSARSPYDSARSGATRPNACNTAFTSRSSAAPRSASTLPRPRGKTEV